MLVLRVITMATAAHVIFTTGRRKKRAAGVFVVISIKQRRTGSSGKFLTVIHPSERSVTLTYYTLTPNTSHALQKADATGGKWRRTEVKKTLSFKWF